jgi:hypothetical protein
MVRGQTSRAGRRLRNLLVWPPSIQLRRLAVDHDHETGEPRGILCTTCNTALGKVKAIPEFINKAMQYLAQYGNSGRG